MWSDSLHTLNEPQDHQQPSRGDARLRHSTRRFIFIRILPYISCVIISSLLYLAASNINLISSYYKIETKLITLVISKARLLADASLCVERPTTSRYLAMLARTTWCLPRSSDKI